MAAVIPIEIGEIILSEVAEDTLALLFQNQLKKLGLWLSGRELGILKVGAVLTWLEHLAWNKYEQDLIKLGREIFWDKHQYYLNTRRQITPPRPLKRKLNQKYGSRKTRNQQKTST